MSLILSNMIPIKLKHNLEEKWMIQIVSAVEHHRSERYKPTDTSDKSL